MIARTPTSVRPAKSLLPAVPERGIGRLIWQCDRAFQFKLEIYLSTFNMTRSQWFHLSELWSEDGLTQVELSARLGIEKASSTQILDNLARRGLIERHRSKADKRKITNHLTKAGRQLASKMIEQIIELIKKSQRGISKTEMAIFLKVLRQLTRNLQGRQT